MSSVKKNLLSSLCVVAFYMSSNLLASENNNNNNNFDDFFVEDTNKDKKIKKYLVANNERTSVLHRFTTQDQKNQNNSYIVEKVNFYSSGLVDWGRYSKDEQKLIDQVAADFYNNGISPSQRENINNETAKIYANFSPDQRAIMRQKRKEKWHSLKIAFKSFENFNDMGFEFLSEYQKAPYRKHAINLLEIKSGKIAYNEI